MGCKLLLAAIRKSPKALSDDWAYLVSQRSPTFLAEGTSFTESNYFTDWGGGAGFGFAHLPATHFQLCSPVPNRPQTSTIP